MASQKPKILLHVCCAVCGAYLIELLKEKYEVILYFYNPNIHPKEEYEKRKESAKKLAEIYNIDFIEEKYIPEKWFEIIKGLENELEGGKRCPICFEMRLRETAISAENNNIPYFTTTLSISPYKDEKIINETGEKIAKEYDLNFLEIGELGNKQDLWQKTKELAKKHNFYHQKYCGCIFSQKVN
ncbi:MAG: epoxyqueuosine reductase QueH [Candidatus Paceibacterota bacterium]|jgi:predicted adenine nucleotide alpha hydrolase (AANH) superfamily ATPase